MPRSRSSRAVPDTSQESKVENALARGDVKAARVALGAIAPGWDPSGITSDMRVAVAVADRNYAEAAHLLATTRRGNLIEFSEVDLGFFEALVAQKQGDNAKASTVLASMREKAEAHLRDLSDDIPVLSRLARIDAYLGRNEDALREICACRGTDNRRGGETWSDNCLAPRASCPGAGTAKRALRFPPSPGDSPAGPPPSSLPRGGVGCATTPTSTQQNEKLLQPRSFCPLFSLGPKNFLRGRGSWPRSKHVRV